MATKTRNDVMQDMSELYEDLKNERIKHEAAAELANIAGKYLKADSLNLAWAMFNYEMSKKGSRIQFTKNTAAKQLRNG